MTITRLFASLFTVCAFGALVLGAGCSKTPTPGTKKPIPTYTQKRVIDRVDWPASSTINHAALAAMKPEERAKVALSGVPVLVPGDVKLLAGGVMIEPNESGYDFGSIGTVDGLDFTIGATRVSTQSDAPVPAYARDPQRPDNRAVVGNRKLSIGRITGDGNEGPWSASWTESGEAGYTLLLECVDVSDARCKDDSYLKSFVASLVYVGGSGK